MPTILYWARASISPPRLAQNATAWGWPQFAGVPSDLDAEVVSLGKERMAGRGVRGLRYERTLIQLLRRLPADALLAPMCPIYINLGAPIAKPLGVRTILWNVHPACTASVRLAERLATVVVASAMATFRDRRGTETHYPSSLGGMARERTLALLPRTHEPTS